MLDRLVRTGPYGDGYSSEPGGLSLDALRASPHGIDLGPLEPRLPDLLCTESGLLEATPAWITDDLPRLEATLEAQADGLQLVGRRELRSNNSWMHNVETLVRGRERCTLHVNPTDAARLGLDDGATAVVTSSVGTVEVAVEITTSVMEGVVSLPHGWGHDRPGVRLRVAAARPGVSTNDLTPPAIDPRSGNAVLNGVRVDIVPA